MDKSRPKSEHSFNSRLLKFKGKRSYGILDCIKKVCKSLKHVNLDHLAEIGELVALLNISFHEFDDIDQLCLILREYGFLNNTIKLLLKIEESNYFTNEKIWAIVYNVYGAIWSYSDIGLDIESDNIRSKDLKTILTNNLMNEKYFKQLDDLKILDLLTATIAIIYNLQKSASDLFNDNKQSFIEQLVKLLQNVKDEQLKILSILLISDLMDCDSESLNNCLSDQNETFLTFMLYLNKAGIIKDKVYNGFQFLELLNCLKCILVKNVNLAKILFTDYGIDYFVNCLDIKKQRYTEDEINRYLSISQLLVKEDNYRQKLKSAKKFKSNIRILKVNCEVVQEISERLWEHKYTLKREDNNVNSVVENPSSEIKKKCIYVSLSNKTKTKFVNQELAKKFIIWQSKSSSFDSLILGMQKSFALVLLLTSESIENEMVKLEFQLALFYKLPVIVIILQNNFKCVDWLKILTLTNDSVIESFLKQPNIGSIETAVKLAQRTLYASQHSPVETDHNPAAASNKTKQKNESASIFITATKTDSKISKTIIKFLDKHKVHSFTNEFMNPEINSKSFQDAKVFVLLVSDSFLKNKFCMGIWNYLQLTNSPLILLLINNQFKSKHWIKFDCSQLKPIEFYDETKIEMGQYLLLEQINNILQIPIDNNSLTPTLKCDWSSNQIRNWLKQLKLKSKSEMLEMNSEALVQIKLLAQRDSKGFQFVLKTFFHIDKVEDIAKLSVALTKLNFDSV